jgi:hypothetical protein
MIVLPNISEQDYPFFAAILKDIPPTYSDWRSARFEPWLQYYRAQDEVIEIVRAEPSDFQTFLEERSLARDLSSLLRFAEHKLRAG